MSASLSISANARTSLSSLRDVSRQIAETQRRLATGKKVSSPLDNAAAYFTSSGLSARASSLESLLDGISTAQRTFEAANTGIKAIESLLKSAKGLADQALASASTLVKVTGTNSSPLTAGSTIATTFGSSTRLRAGDTITVSDGTTTATYTAANNDTVQAFLNAVNGTANLKIDASLNPNGQLQLLATEANNIVVGGSFNGSGTLNGVTGLTAGTTAFTANASRTVFAQQFDVLRAQIDQAVADSGIGKVNLLDGSSLDVKLNETGTSKLSVAGSSLSSTSLGVSASTGQFQTDADVNASLSAVTAALTSLQAQTSSITSGRDVLDIRRDFISSMADTLRAGADDLVAADLNEESALLLALQTRQQIATTALSLAGQQDQTALRLFGLG